MSYICSRYYRAPELIFGATDYTSSIGMNFQYLYMVLYHDCTLDFGNL